MTPVHLNYKYGLFSPILGGDNAFPKLLVHETALGIPRGIPVETVLAAMYSKQMSFNEHGRIGVISTFTRV